MPTAEGIAVTPTSQHAAYFPVLCGPALAFDFLHYLIHYGIILARAIPGVFFAP